MYRWLTSTGWLQRRLRAGGYTCMSRVPCRSQLWSAPRAPHQSLETCLCSAKHLRQLSFKTTLSSQSHYWYRTNPRFHFTSALLPPICARRGWSSPTPRESQSPSPRLLHSLAPAVVLRSQTQHNTARPRPSRPLHRPRTNWCRCWSRVSEQPIKQLHLQRLR